MRTPIFVVALLLAGCKAATPATTADSPSAHCDPSRSLAIGRSPGGTPEVEAREAWAQRCSTQIVDVREKRELTGELGHAPGSVWMPLHALAELSAGLDPDQPVAVMCRSGRRSGAAARWLEDNGFVAASVVGGMRGWQAEGLPVSHEIDFSPAALPEVAARALEEEDLAIHLGDPRKVRWTKVARLVDRGHESCVDGRDGHAVLGTPGGDAGELLLALASYERLSGRELSSEALERLFDSYVDAFGQFYLHTDEHALEALHELMHGEAFEAALAGVGHEMSSLVRSPPEAIRPALLEALTVPEAIGCGHLRLVTQHPDDYGVRRELVADLIRAFFERLWATSATDIDGEPALELQVLGGSHKESAILVVGMEDQELRSFSRVPMVSPSVGGGQVFVVHPQVASFVRRENVAFLASQGLFEGMKIDRDAFFLAIEELAAQQLSETVGHLAKGLPVYDARFAPDQTFSVVAR